MKEHLGDISGSKNICQKHSQCSSQRFEYALPFSLLGLKNANS
jgi:hypothetical protein